MFRYKQDFGKSSESQAVEYLMRNGYKILEVNYRTKLGEIDIIAKDKGTICFVEVKSRSSLSFGSPKEALDERKQHKISRVALTYLKSKNYFDEPCRFDVFSIIKAGVGSTDFELIKDAFSLDSAYNY